MLYGFSTGALAKGEFRQALAMLEPHSLGAIEVSALRLSELERTVDELPSLDLARYRHVSVHVPSKYRADEEPGIVAAVARVIDRVDGVVLHAEAVLDAALWHGFGAKVWVENADLRKHTGRTCDEMLSVMARLPDARVCFDMAHAYQIDFSLVESRRILRAFEGRVAQIHLSQLDHACRHEALSYGIVDRFRLLAPMLVDVPVILESCVPSNKIASQVRLARSCFEPQVYAEAFAAAE